MLRVQASCHRFLAAFGLLEAAIALIILGLLMSMAMGTMRSMRVQAQAALTRQHQEKVRSALAAFVARNDCLPCPHVEDQGAEKGWETRTGKDFECVHEMGAVPYHTLGLTEAESRDGYHGKMLYVVDRSLTQRGGMGPSEDRSLKRGGNFCGREPLGYLKVQAAHQPDSLSMKANAEFRSHADGTTNAIAFILISYGPSGRGSPFGSVQGNGAEQENDGTNFIFVTAAPQPFEHKVMAVTRDNFAMEAFGTPCQKSLGLSEEVLRKAPRPD